MQKHSILILSFSSDISTVRVQHLSSLSQPVTVQADNNEPSEGLYIGFIREQLIEFNVLG